MLFLRQKLSQVSVSRSAEGGQWLLWGQLPSLDVNTPSFSQHLGCPCWLSAFFKFRVHRIASVGRIPQGLSPVPARDNPKKSWGLFSFQYVLSSVLCSIDLLSFKVCFPDLSKVPQWLWEHFLSNCSWWLSVSVEGTRSTFDYCNKSSVEEYGYWLLLSCQSITWSVGQLSWSRLLLKLKRNSQYSQGHSF